MSTVLATNLLVSRGAILTGPGNAICLPPRVAPGTFVSFDKIINLVILVTFVWNGKLR